MSGVFILNSALLGFGLAMDAFSVSIVNGLNEPYMSRRKMTGIAGTYALFQFAMPMTGWFCVHTIAEQFIRFQQYIPWIALILLGCIGGNMLYDGIRKMKARKNGLTEDETGEKEGGESPEKKNSGKSGGGKHVGAKSLGVGTLMLQGIATSIDALSVGFTISSYGTASALVCCLIIAAVTFVLCMTGLIFGKKFGEALTDKASIFGGIILIGIGLEIFLKDLL